MADLNTNTDKIFFLCNEEQKDLLDTEVVAIFEQKTFDHYVTNSIQTLKQAKGIIILAELDWGYNYYSDFSGLRIIHELRMTHDFDVPIILTSNYPNISFDGLKYHSNFSKSEFRFLKDSSVLFYPLDFFISKSNSSLAQCFDSSINDPLLKIDLKENLYQEAGYLLNIFNDLSYTLLDINYPIDFHSVKDIFCSWLKTLKNIIIDVHIQERLERELNSLWGSKLIFELDDLKNIPEILKDIVIKSYESHTAIDNFPPEEAKILYIREAQKKQSFLEEQFSAFGIKCIVVSNSKAAIEVLKSIDICVIVSEFRFYAEDGRFNREQGYHILNSIYDQIPNLYYSVVLSNFESPLISQYFTKSVNPMIIKRESLQRSNSLFSRFAQFILSKDAEIRKEKNFLPEFGEAMPLYLNHLNSSDYDKSEKNIIEFTNDFLRKLINKKNLPHFDSPGGSLERKTEEDTMMNFRIKLKSRRVALGICQLPASILNNAFENTELWSVIYSCINIGQVIKDIDPKTYQPFVSKHLFKMKTNSRYYWKNAAGLRLTNDERNWLIKHGEDLENGRML